jgi:hypothetical protein
MRPGLKMVLRLPGRSCCPDRSRQAWYWKSARHSRSPDPAMGSDLACWMYLDWQGSDCFYIRRLRMLMQGRAKSKVQIGGEPSSFYLYGTLDAVKVRRFAFPDAAGDGSSCNWLLFINLRRSTKSSLDLQGLISARPVAGIALDYWLAEWSPVYAPVEASDRAGTVQNLALEKDRPPRPVHGRSVPSCWLHLCRTEAECVQRHSTDPYRSDRESPQRAFVCRIQDDSKCPESRGPWNRPSMRTPAYG